MKCGAGKKRRMAWYSSSIFIYSLFCISSLTRLGMLNYGAGPPDPIGINFMNYEFTGLASVSRLTSGLKDRNHSLFASGPMIDLYLS